MTQTHTTTALTAAAPALLAALEEMVAFTELLVAKSRVDTNPHLIAARAAIALARGGVDDLGTSK